MKKLHLILGAIALSTMTAVRANASVLYSQPSNNIGFFYSQQDTSGSGSDATTYDNFTLATTSTINNVTWVGGFLPGDHTGISSFTLTFYQDNAGQPGSALAVETISGNAGETALGTDLLGDDTYAYGANLPTALTATGGTQYWLSVVANLNTGGTFIFGWMNANPGDSSGFQDIFGARSPIVSDSAFTLSDNAASVPEPTTFALLTIGAGICGVVGLRRRMKTAVAAE